MPKMLKIVGICLLLLSFCCLIKLATSGRAHTLIATKKSESLEEKINSQQNHDHKNSQQFVLHHPQVQK